MAQAAQAGDTRELVEGGGDTDSGVQAGAGRGDQVNRDELGVAGIGGLQGGDAGLDFVQQGRVGRAEVGAGGGGGVIRIGSSGREATPEIFGIAKLLADQA